MMHAIVFFAAVSAATNSASMLSRGLQTDTAAEQVTLCASQCALAGVAFLNQHNE
jgi:hypothetical protein